MNLANHYQRPVVICRWPGRPQSDHDLGASILSTLSAVEAAMSMTLAWSADVGSENDFSMMPFRTDLEPTHLDLEPFVKLDDAGDIWAKGGLAILLYGSIPGASEGHVVSVTGTVGATTRWGNSIKIAFPSEDPQTVPSGPDLATLVAAVGETWDALWCAAISDEIVDEVDRPAGEPGVGLITYWADSLQPSLPPLDEATVRKTAKGTIATIHDMNSERAISYAKKVHAGRA